MKKKRRYLKFLLIIPLVLCLFFGMSFISRADSEVIETTSYFRFDNTIPNTNTSFESALTFQIQNDIKVYNEIYVYQYSGVVQIIYSSPNGSKLAYNNGWISQDYRYITLLPQTIDNESELGFNFVTSHAEIDIVLLPYTTYTFNIGLSPESDFAIHATFSTLYNVPSYMLNNSVSSLINFDYIGYNGETESVIYGLSDTIFIVKPDDNHWVKNYRSIIFDRQEITAYEYENLLNVGIFGIVENDEIIIDNENLQSQSNYKDIGLIVLTIAQAPVNMITQFLDVNVLGVNLFAVFSFIITLSLVVFVIKKVL